MTVIPAVLGRYPSYLSQDRFPIKNVGNDEKEKSQIAYNVPPLHS
jgi:hypothetical protein